MSRLAPDEKVLRSEGKLRVLQPDVRYCGKDYWMSFDHITPVADRALVEVLAAAGFDVELNIPRFLPDTTKSRVPSGPRLVSLSLKVLLAYKVMGAQAFMVGRLQPS